MTKFIQNLEDKTQSVLMEGLSDDAAELTGVDKEIVDDAVKGLSYANYLELGNAIDIGDAETVKEILGTVADLVPGDDIDLEESDPFYDKPIPGKKLAEPARSWGEILWKLSDRKLTKLYNQKMDACGGVYNPGTSAVTPIKKEMILRGLLTEGWPKGWRKPQDPWMPDVPVPSEFKKDGRVMKRRKGYKAWLQSEKDKASSARLKEVEDFELEEPIDMMGKPCYKCKKGYFTETGFHDDMDGVQHCTECGWQTNRYITKFESGTVEEEYIKGRAPNKSKNYLRKGGNKQQFKWRIELNNGKVLLRWADSRRNIDLSPEQHIIGVKSAKKIKEADNPSKPAAATPTQPAVTPPSAGSSIDAIAEPAETAVDVDNQEVQQGRKEVDDLDVGDEIEVADIDGEPAAGRVRNANGPGDTIVITGKGDEEHMIRKDSILSTPIIDVGVNGIQEGRVKDFYWDEAERMTREEFVAKYGKDLGEFWDSVRGVYEAKMLEKLKEQFGDKMKDKEIVEAVQDIDVGREIKVGSTIGLAGGQGGEVRAIMPRSFIGRAAKVRFYGSGNSGQEFFYVRIDDQNRVLPNRVNESLSEGRFEADADQLKRIMGTFKEYSKRGSSDSSIDYMILNTNQNLTNYALSQAYKKLGILSDPNLRTNKRAKKYAEKKGLEEGFGEETYDEMVEYWKQSLSQSIVRKGVFTELYNAAGKDIDELNTAIEEEAYSIADSYHGTGEGIGSSDQNHFIASVARSLGVEDVFGWNKPKLASDEDMERDKTTRHAKYNKAIRAEGLNEGEDFHFYVEPQEVGALVVSSKGEIHDFYEDETEARQVAEQLNTQYGKVEEDVSFLTFDEIEEIQRAAGIQVNEVKSGRFKSKAIGNTVKIVGQDDYGNSEHDGKIGTIISAERDPTFSQMVPFKIIYGIRLEDGTRAYVRRSNIRKIKIQETASGGATGAGAIASSPAAMNGMRSRNPSIYGQTKLRKKPEPKKRATREEAGEGIGRSKKK